MAPTACCWCALSRNRQRRPRRFSRCPIIKLSHSRTSRSSWNAACTMSYARLLRIPKDCPTHQTSKMFRPSLILRPPTFYTFFYSEMSFLLCLQFKYFINLSKTSFKNEFPVLYNSSNRLLAQFLQYTESARPIWYIYQ